MFLVLAIATEGVDLVAQGEASISGGLCGLCCWVCFDSGLLDCVDCVDSRWVDLVAGFVFLVCWVCCRWVLWIPVWVGGCVGKEMNILFE